MSIFRGAGVAIITPMLDNGDVNYEKLAELLDEQIENGTDAICICGTTGEACTLTEKEHSDTIAFTVKHVNGRVPVVAGTGSNCTRTAINLSKQAEFDGADGLLIVTPYYNKATQKGLIEHYTAIAKETKLPIIMYNVPSRTGTNISANTAVTLAKNVENIVGIKEASGNITQVSHIAAHSRGHLDIYSGNDDQIIPLMSLGAIGVISVLSNVAPKQTHDMTQAFFDGDTQLAAKLQLDAIPLVDALFCEVNPIPVKTAMNMLGKQVGPLRMPLGEMEAHTKEQLRKAMVEYGLKLKGDL